MRLVAERSRAALHDGSLEPIQTRVENVDDEGSRFSIRVVSSLQRRATTVTSGDPFLPPYSPGLFVGEISATHVSLLNKYPVLEQHALVVTRAFEAQTSPLTEADFSAVLPLLHAAGGLVFYNSGAEAGASQPHKHLQWVPRPPDAQLRAPLPFVHASAVTPSQPGEAVALYRALLERSGASGRAYNLLMTRESTWVVPRRQERFEGVSLNALAFAGSLFVKSEDELATLKRAGPTRALQAVAG